MGYALKSWSRGVEASAASPALHRSPAERPAAKCRKPATVERDEIVIEHLPLVRSIANRIRDTLPVHVDLDDLINSGILGLIDAATKYNATKEVVFSAYAKHRIKGAILDSLRDQDWASRDMRQRHKRVEAVAEALASELQRIPTDAEMANRLGVDEERWRSMRMELSITGLVSADTGNSSDEDSVPLDLPTSPETHPDAICFREQLNSHLGDAVSKLPPRQQQIVNMYYANEMTMKEIGDALGINESRVSQIHKTALKKMSMALQEAGIQSSAALYAN